MLHGAHVPDELQQVLAQLLIVRTAQDNHRMRPHLHNTRCAVESLCTLVLEGSRALDGSVWQNT